MRSLPRLSLMLATAAVVACSFGATSAHAAGSGTRGVPATPESAPWTCDWNGHGQDGGSCVTMKTSPMPLNPGTTSSGT